MYNATQNSYYKIKLESHTSLYQSIDTYRQYFRRVIVYINYTRMAQPHRSLFCFQKTPLS